MNLEQATKLVNELVLARFERPLRDVEVAILQGSWEGKTYDKIAAATAYHADYLRNDAGPRFWKILSEALGESVGKKSFRAVLERTWRSLLSRKLSENPSESNATQDGFLPAEITGSSINVLYDPLKDLAGADLRGVGFNRADLSNRDLIRADLSGADFSYANLSGANLSKTHVLNTNFREAILTGACIEDWNINSNTNFDGVVCDYIYLKESQQERRPLSRNFAPGEFDSLCRMVRNAADLIFQNENKGNKFLDLFQQIKVNSGGSELTVESIENEKDGILVVRVKTPPATNKKEIEEFLNHAYGMKLKTMEDMYLFQIKIKDEQLEFYHQHNSKLMGILERIGDRTIKHVEQISSSLVQASLREGVLGNREQQIYRAVIEPQREVDKLTVINVKNLIYKSYKDNWKGHKVFRPNSTSNVVDFIIETPAGSKTGVVVEFSRGDFSSGRLGELISILRNNRIPLDIVTSLIVFVSDDENVVNQWQLSLTDKMVELRKIVELKNDANFTIGYLPLNGSFQVKYNLML